MRTNVTAAVLLAVTAGLGGCSGPTREASEGTFSAHGPDPRIVTLDPSPDRIGPFIRHRGTLVYDRATRCLLMEYDDHTEAGPRGLPLWPPGTNPIIRGDRRGVDHPAAGILVEGDKVVTNGTSASPKSGPAFFTSIGMADCRSKAQSVTSLIERRATMPRVHGGDPRIVVYDAKPEIEMRASLLGTLAYDPASRCLLMEYQPRILPYSKATMPPHHLGPRGLPKWPPGTRPILRNGRRGVVHPVKGILLEGDTIIAASAAAGVNPDIATLDLPRGCLSRASSTASVASDWNGDRQKW